MVLRPRLLGLCFRLSTSRVEMAAINVLVVAAMVGVDLVAASSGVSRN